jgi:hypothetical protein
MSVSPAPEIPNLVEREGLVVAMVVIVVLHDHLPVVGSRRRIVKSLVQLPALARAPPPEEQGVVVLFPTNSNAMESSELSAATSAEQPDGAVAVKPTAPPAVPVPLHSGPRPPPRRRGLQPRCPAPCLDSAAPVATRPDVSPAGPPRPGQTPRSRLPSRPERRAPSITALRCWCAMVGRNAIAWSPPERRRSPPTRCRRGRKVCGRVTRRPRFLEVSNGGQVRMR